MSLITTMAFWAAKQVVCAAAPAVAKAVCVVAAKATAAYIALRATSNGVKRGEPLFGPVSPKPMARISMPGLVA